MQLIPLNQLKELAAKGKSLSEAESKRFSYDEFKREYSKTYDFITKSGSEDPEQATYKILLEGWIKDHCPPIELIGEGSSRGAFACGDGKCLKIAMNDAGLKQNESEAKNTMFDSLESYSIFAQTYDKADRCTSLLTECCSKITLKDWQKMWNIDDNTFSQAPESYILVIATTFHDNGNDWDKCIQALEKPQAAFARRIQAAREPAMKTLSSLFKFYSDNESNWENLMPFDLCTEENWGAAIRFGEVVPVIIDAGFSKDTFGGLLDLL